jgi:hypothetical protein
MGHVGRGLAAGQGAQRRGARLALGAPGSPLPQLETEARQGEAELRDLDGDLGRLAVARMGLELWERGARSAQGEASAATLGALAGGETAAHVAHLNLKFAGAGEWAESRKKDVRDLRRSLRELRNLAEARIYDQDDLT